MIVKVSFKFTKSKYINQSYRMDVFSTFHQRLISRWGAWLLWKHFWELFLSPRVCGHHRDPTVLKQNIKWDKSRTDACVRRSQPWASLPQSLNSFAEPATAIRLRLCSSRNAFLSSGREKPSTSLVFCFPVSATIAVISTQFLYMCTQVYTFLHFP